ncbi:hypothetical protein LMG23992_04700 [Cupriavidus laharis]|uniref:Tripartite tricarboxylate transporter substrate binding protein n=1 Tax=Cupriavidus laharis TaxID=151654 RepID=A0ABN7ZDW8_9BURK|nr:tripartite tricarboxylate transporter substrate-binding protein [Cupriavidus laharis]CAG9182262.1 hypothetical protein LMG23992_04700 [Cupriavidus laharis]
MNTLSRTAQQRRAWLLAAGLALAAATTLGHVGPARAGTPAPVVDRLSREIATVLQEPELKATLASNGYEPVGSTPDALRSHIDAEITRWSKVVKDSGAQVQ